MNDMIPFRRTPLNDAAYRGHDKLMRRRLLTFVSVLPPLLACIGIAGCAQQQAATESAGRSAKAGSSAPVAHAATSPNTCGPRLALEVLKADDREVRLEWSFVNDGPETV